VFLYFILFLLATNFKY